MADHQGLPVAGYRPQDAAAIDVVNGFKEQEECLLRQLDVMADSTAPHRFDQRWLAIARTHFEQGFMALNRSVFRPERIRLPRDEKPE